jgi:hypothetical protein
MGGWHLKLKKLEGGGREPKEVNWVTEKNYENLSRVADVPA